MENPIDTIWSDRPAPPCAAVFAHPQRFAGEAAAEKLTRASRQHSATANFLLLSNPHADCLDIQHPRPRRRAIRPCPLAFAVIRRDAQPILYHLGGERLAASIGRDVGRTSPRSRSPERLTVGSRDPSRQTAPSCLFDAATVPAFLTDLFRSRRRPARASRADPVSLMKARKNATEQRGARQAQRRDGAADDAISCHWFDSGRKRSWRRERNLGCRSA